MLEEEKEIVNLESFSKHVSQETETLLERIASISPELQSPLSRRLLGIIEACTTDELSVDELAQRFEVHYQTMYGNVKSLVNAGLLKLVQKSHTRTHFYRTNWADVPGNMKGVELRWRSGSGEFFPVSTYIDKFLFLGPRRLAYEVEMFGRMLVANHVEKQLDYMEETGYGKEHENAIFVRMNASIEFLENILTVMKQAVDSPILREPTGFQMYQLPDSITPEDASQIHDEVEMYFQQEGYYGSD